MRTTRLALLGVLFAFNVDGGVAWAENGVPVQLTRDDITAIRSRLRDLDYDVKPAGALDDAVRSAIREFLKNIGEPPADFLTSEQLARLKAIDTSSYLYAAVAASTDAKYAVVWNRKSHDQAESEAMSGCAAKSSKSDKCTVIARADATTEGWVAAVNCKRKDGRTTHIAVGLGAVVDVIGPSRWPILRPGIWGKKERLLADRRCGSERPSSVGRFRQEQLA
jgi:hypothetical protein